MNLVRVCQACNTTSPIKPFSSELAVGVGAIDLVQASAKKEKKPRYSMGQSWAVMQKGTRLKLLR